MSLSALSLLAVFMATPASAQDTIPPVDAKCSAAIAQQETNACAIDHYRRVQQRVDEAFEKLYQSVGSDIAPHLAAAQHRWADFRDAECGFVAAKYPGSMQPMQRAICLAELAEARLAQLREHTSSGT